MNSVELISAAIFLAVAALAWFVINAGDKVSQEYQHSFIRSARFNLEEMFLFVDPKRLFYLNLAAIAIVLAVVFAATGNPLLVVLAAVFTAVFPRFYYKWLRARRYAKFEEQLPDAVMMISGSLRAGASLSGALASMVKEQRPPLSQEFDLMLRETRIGVALDEALLKMGKRIPSADFGLVLSAVRIAREVGGNLAETLERLAETLRQKQAMEGKIRSLTAQGKLQGIVVGLLPLVLALVLFQMEPEGMAPLFRTLTGWAVCAVVIVLEIMGMLMIRKIINIDV